MMERPNTDTAGPLENGKASSSSLHPDTIEEALESARWIGCITDPSIVLDELHEKFELIIFNYIPVGTSAASDDDEPRRELRTAADRRRESRRKEAMRAALRELQDPVADGGGTAVVHDGDVDGSESDEGTGHDDDAADDEEYADEFLNWIHSDEGVDAEPGIAAVTGSDARGAGRVSENDAAIDLGLERVGLGGLLWHVEESHLPERLQYIEISEKRPNLGPKALPGRLRYELSLEHEAFWILRQLRNPGQPLAHNARIGRLASKSVSEVQREPVVTSIAYALRMMTREYMEPAHLMVYHHTELAPLLHALWEDSPSMRRAEGLLANPSYAFCKTTGRRQSPVLYPTYVGFNLLAGCTPNGSDAMWGTLETGSGPSSGGGSLVQRKPCFIELGRLLVRILDLDILCHTLEHRRQLMLLSLSDCGETHVQQQRELLSHTIFEDRTAADFWQSYVQFLRSSGRRGASHRVKMLRLERAFEEYTITGVQYSENFYLNTPIHMCPQPTGRVMDWADQIGQQLVPARAGDFIINLFNKAIVEEFSKLPLVLKKLFDLFCAEGDLIVTYTPPCKPQEVCPIVSFFAEYPKHYAELLDLERSGVVSLSYLLDESLIRNTLNVPQLFDNTGNVEWTKEKMDAIDLLVSRLHATLVPRVQAALMQAADAHVQAECVERLASLCEDGPYAPTQLMVEAFSSERLTWDPSWNVVEAIPVPPLQAAAAAAKQFGFSLRTGSSTGARVCAAYRSENNVTCFCFTDEVGAVIGTTRWADCAMNSEAGRSANMLQNITLEKFFRKCSPTVVAVGASSVASLSLMRTMQAFVRERLQGACMCSIPVVWTPVEVARQCSFTSYADAETPNMDTMMRTAMSLARFVRDPLCELCALFDRKKTVLNLSLGIPPAATHSQKENLYRLLEWEMSLWVAACGLDITEEIHSAHSVSKLQFVPGLGMGKARQLLQHLEKSPVASRTELRVALKELFGDFVTRNAVCALRVGIANADTAATLWHPLDQTLLPLEWYSAAELIASHCVGSTCSRPLALLELSQTDDAAQRELLLRNGNVHNLLHLLRDRARSEWDGIKGEREVDLIVDEILAMGQSCMRRPYRRITTQQLMSLVTGIVYLSKSDVESDAAHASPALCISEGDYITGTVVGVTGGHGMPSIRILTSRGLRAVIAAVDVADLSMRQQLEQHATKQEERRLRHKDEGLSGTDTTPDWLRRGSLIQGTVSQCNWDRCELRLKWCKARAPEAFLLENERATVAQLFECDQNDGASSVNTVGTDNLEREARIFTTKISRHVLFRDITNAKAVELLQGRDLGEILLRPSRRRTNEVTCAIKVGKSSISNWLLREERRPNGALFYILSDQVTEKRHEFDEVDEFIQQFVDPMIALIKGMRFHRRFVRSVDAVRASLDTQVRQNERAVAYAFAETGYGERLPNYRLYMRTGSVEQKYRLHIDCDAIYVRVPMHHFARHATKSDSQWIKCDNAEQVSEFIKKLAGGLLLVNSTGVKHALR